MSEVVCVSPELMSNPLETIFAKKFQEYNIEIFGTNNDPLFKAKQIGDMLGIVKIRDTIQNMDDLCKVKIRAGTTGGDRDQWFLTEDGLIELLCISKKLIAKEFRIWVRSVVKEIRMTGEYTLKKLLEQKNEKELELINELANKDIELTKKINKLKEIKTMNTEMYYYIVDISPGKLKAGITSDLENTLMTYRRGSTITDFYWTWKFVNLRIAYEVETIIKAISFRYREKSNNNTEIFNMNPEKFQKLAYTIIKIYDSPDSNMTKEIDYFLSIFEEDIKDIKEYINDKFDKMQSTNNTPPINITIPNNISVINEAPVQTNESHMVQQATKDVMGRIKKAATVK